MELKQHVQIRDAVKADAGVLLAFVRELAAYEHLSHLVSATEADLRELLFGPDAVARAILANDGEATVGFAIYYFSVSTFAGRPNLFIEDIYVRPERRAKGVGKRMLVDLARRAVARRCARMEWMVLDWNEPARSFYRSLGADARNEWLPYALKGEALERLAKS